jgi:hypothetical protein
LGFYLQDDFRTRSNLTLNLGLRYEFHTEVGAASGFDNSLRDIRLDSAYTPGAQFLNPSLKNFSPRFGFAWDVKGNSKTAVRGAFGILYDIGAWAQSLNLVGSLLSSPGRSSNSVSSTEFPQYSTITSLPLVFAPETQGKNVNAIDYHVENPHLLTYNFTVDRQLPFDMALTLGYAGSRGLNLLSTKAGNPRPQTVLLDGRFTWAGTESRVNPAWGSISYITSAVSSWYNSLQFTLRKQLSRGLQFQSSYTWGKLLDQRGGVTGSDTGGSPAGIATTLLPLSLDKGPGEANTDHSWRFNAIYRLPQPVGLNGIAEALLSGWSTSGILSMQTGLPFTVTTGGTDRSRSLGAGNNPDLNPGRWNPNIISGTTAGCAGVAPGQKLGTPDLYYDPCAFSLEPNGFLGTAGRNILTAPGLVNLDFSMVKDTKLQFLGEGGSIQFRAEVFNILNRANFSRPERSNFSAPNATVVDTAGSITDTDSTSRQVQLALKVIW